MHGRKADWKKFTELKAVALERFCESILNEATEIAGKRDSTAHERYLDVYELIRQRDREIVKTFDGHSRSRADLQLGLMYSLDLVTEDELETFSEETKLHARSWKWEP
jgi:hypothetical protein